MSICLVSFASGLSVVTLNLHHRGLRGTEVPYVMRRIILGGLAPLVCLKFDLAPPSRSPSGATADPTATGNTLASDPDSVETALLDNKTTPGDPRCTCTRASARNSAHNLHAMQNSTSGAFNVSATRASGW